MPDLYGGVADHLAPGTRLNDMFEIDRRIASGGMGEIYQGHAIETGLPVAVKVMRTDLVNNETAFALFRKEASALNQIQHDAVVRCFIFSSDPRIRRHYLAMEFVDGEPLSELIKRGPLAYDDVRLLQRRIASGLDAAHWHGIIHRDVSPDNIIVPDSDVGRAKIIDFGIARSTRAGARTIIGSGFAGKYDYVSPEQLGLFGGDVTAKSDIYSLGIVLAQCLSGKSIDMGGSEFEVVEKRRVVPNLAAVDARLRPLLARRGRYADRAVSGCPTFKQMRSHHELYPIARGHGFEWRNSMFELYVAVDLDTLIGLTMLLAAFRAIIRQIR